MKSALLASLLLAGTAIAGAGSPDTTFGGDGRVRLAFDLDGDSLLDELHAAVAGPGGVTYLVGHASVPANPQFPDLGGAAIAIARLTHTGKPDATYGKAGRVVHADPAAAHLVMLDAALAPDGALLTAGYATTGDVRMAACRFAPDGNVDAAFGNALTPGCAVIDLPGNFDVAHAVLAMPDGRIALGGEDGQGKAVLAMLDAAGAMLPAFGDGGVRRLGDGVVADLAFDDGALVAVGQHDAGEAHAFVARLDASDGSNIAAFGGGVVAFDLGAPGGGADAFVAVSVAPGGDLVAAGWSEDGGIGRGVLVRFDATGAPVAGFGDSGVQQFHAPEGVDRRWIDAVDATHADHLFVAGRDIEIVLGHPFVAAIAMRLLPDGSPDASFGTEGVAIANLDLPAHPSDTALVVHGARPLVAATIGADPDPPLTGDYAAARFEHGLAHARLTVTPKWGPGGSIKPVQPVQVGYSNVASFLVVAKPGFGIATVDGCGGALFGNTYITDPVLADCSVIATFAPLP
ncbi:hypothetical protein [Chiayiivirga flava]|uniref:Putative delta-60 repeat protein n=1 Tax=Chiayiivirga flava TaxID=659595 RepID=A0A7W8G0J9_9GAMM|nr:hypothetical protein [Chiayiivirga flava]MBB5207848.1 putative delta-60 repeat protein [Chiayiivirga flava]